MEQKPKPVDTTIKQKRLGYATPRRIRELRIGPGNVVGGWAIDTAGSFASDADDSGFRILLDSANKRITFEGGVSIKNTAAGFTDTGGMVIEHDTGEIAVEVGGSGVGNGPVYAVIRDATGSVFVGVTKDLLGSARVIMGGLPTSPFGLTSGMLWDDGGFVRVA